MTAPKLEVWQRGPIDGVPALLQPAAHAMLGAAEELRAIARDLTRPQLWARPLGMASVGFHVAHVAGVIDRLLTYARDESLSLEQRSALAAEAEPGEPPRDAASLLDALDATIARALDQLRATDPATLADARALGRAKLPTTIGGLIFHAAEHAQRHTGQALVTARIVVGA